jgi:capsid protein
LGVSTLDRETMLLTGENFEDVTRQRGKEVEARKAAGLVDTPKPGAAAPFQSNEIDRSED